MSLRNNLHVLRLRDEDPNPETVFELVMVQGGIELRVATREITTRPLKPLWTWKKAPTSSHSDSLKALEAIIEELEICFNVFRVQIGKLESVSSGGKPQNHVDSVLNAVLAGMRHHATLANSRVLAVASVSSVAKIKVRIVGISPEVAQMAATREAGHPAER